MKKIYAKYGYEENYVNNSKLKKLYYLYLHQTVFDKILDILVLFAIIFTIIELSSHVFFSLPENIYRIFQSFTVLIFLIFGLELFREYVHSKSCKHFMKKHALDLVLVVFLSFYFFAGSYFGLAKIKMIAETNKYASKIKQLKIVAKLVGFR